MSAKAVKIPANIFEAKPIFADAKMGIRVTRWNKPRSKEQADALGRFFKSNGLSFDLNRVGQKPIVSLSPEKNLELKSLLGFAGRKDLKFYHDNRNLFCLTSDNFANQVPILRMYLYRVRGNGSLEESFYAVCSFEKRENKISSVSLHRKFLEEELPLRRPMAGHSGRGILHPFVDFLHELGYSDFKVSPSESAEEAYERSGFKPPLVKGGEWHYRRSAEQ